MRRKRIGLLTCAVVVAVLSGCQLGYYGQAIKGHWSLMSKRQPVAEALADPATPRRVRDNLRLAEEVLDFAADRMGLPARGVYRQYVALESRAVVWNLMAAPAFSLTPETWCYPFAGCVSYRGYFDREAALRAARDLDEQGFDTYVGGAAAYSTLGWFNDPLTTPMLNRSRADMVDLLLHELVHRRLYVKGDTRFNESLATMVAREGTTRFMAGHDLTVDLERWRDVDRARAAFLAMVSDTRAALIRLYASDVPEWTLTERKDRLIGELRQRYQSERRQLPALDSYQGFFQGPLNNAQLNGVGDYYGLVPAFQALLLGCGGHWPCFWEQVERLADDQQARWHWQQEIP
ncbi:hypothetical protein A6D6_03459 [Alcanivorax xiamenensis]|uniref:Aminopeptidase n=1 Tax=Alcanivorax xiamenensis TaxID=1177156 RepID=A0ABQ6Y450_9GAMM|nr:aminopeptidase [Alcanivorax xiamenensis]KAF0803994.1 hypothetical protein A6D6_03459 [Alcanivorax xiamenensis]